MSSGNAIRDTLDAVGIPWRESRSTLAERYGARPHPAYQWDVIEIASTRPIVDGLLWPLSVLVLPRFSPHLPATDYSGSVWLGDDARENLRLAEEELAGKLGPGEVAGSSNTLGRRWVNGPASISLMVWPRDMQSWSLQNPAEEREPRLKAACSLVIKTGFRLPPTPGERAALASFERIARLPNHDPTLAAVGNTPARESELEFVRKPIPELEAMLGWIGCSADKSWLIFFTDQLYLVPLAAVIGFHVERVLPAKGAGGSYLQVECRTDYGTRENKQLAICSAAGPEELNELAELVAARTEKPFTLGPHQYDA